MKWEIYFRIIIWIFYYLFEYQLVRCYLKYKIWEYEW
jgi:hypothetical protein